MAPPRVCPECGSTDIITEHSLGTVVCQQCGIELEAGILVSEVGFAEGSGGRIHLQGTFVSHNATGIGYRGAGPSSENIKEAGRKRIQQVCIQMGIMPSVQRGAQRFYSLAVDNKFNRGRRTDYVVASCIYLYSRFEEDALMLIDFSERLQINVYELGATYLKLRNVLKFDHILPEIDPAVYNIRFANRLDFGAKASTVARDASRLIKRFKADWMTSGRRPAGICGACLIIAARMNDFLRTPEEVAQVVKVSPMTIQKRLIEFSQTAAATKTVEEWRALSDADLMAPQADELPPIMKKQRLKQEKERLKRERTEALLADGEEEADDADAKSTSSPASGKKRARAGSDLDEPAKRARLRRHDDEAAIGALRDVTRGLPTDGAGGETDEEDEELNPLDREDYFQDLQKAGDNSEEAKADRRLRRRHLLTSAKVVEGDEDAELEMAYAEGEDEDGELEDNEKGEGRAKGDDDEDVDLEAQAAAMTAAGWRELPPPPDWDDTEAVYNYIEEHFFADDEVLYGGSKTAMRERIDKWLQGRPAWTVIEEMQAVRWAHYEREYRAKTIREETFDDIDDEELEALYVMSDDERDTRARMWLSANGKWLEEDKIRQEKKAAYNRAHGIDPSKPKPARNKKRGQGGGRRGPFNSTQDAMQAFASQKKFSQRINMDAMRKLEMGVDLISNFGDEKDDDGLERMDDEKLDEKYNEKHDKDAGEEFDWSKERSSSPQWY